ncbi:Protein MODIFIER OF SNC1 1 [Quillaja saponaria]|uniref:Protein MODIFIER OF SNC1 1 n=1 Tax=Quillaja saponaria TaxID=32244 RepID=A0AAD7LDP0_QUISA|nr:Protein MODIFIER OF SNC1 1 [Quillaja saponaria]KAJ7956210.1 Protein MODIFIER OF SNC1 1 [Quillaja saponaria]
MSSSMLTGERRWASSSRRGGMTVLGKVAVPKPINLPSQRLENHGLDPNVEIVPKGTLSWGSRVSSSAPNAWGSSALSPTTDGGTGSPSHLSSRPSSGGSNTRPSTAGSDRAHEPTANAWGPSSRPSSASGALTSSQSSVTSLRPRSAETRPGSSQLSRFAEPLTESSVAWNAPGTSEKLGVSQAKKDGFSLTSGDFPTLGSDKDKSGRNPELQDKNSHGHPGSSSGLGKEKNGTYSVGDPANANVVGETVNSSRRDSPPHSDDGVRPSVEKWPGNPQPYPGATLPPQHYDVWHGPPVNNPQGGVWFRGPGGPPFGNPVPPGGFPMEPFPYYRPHMPPTGLANPPPVPPPGIAAHHPKNGDMYRPHMPDAYIRPGMPIRPGFYPGPVAYDDYYGPPMGYCNSTERDVPFMGISAGLSVYKRYSGQNPPEPGNSHCRSGAHTSEKLLVSEQTEPNHFHDNRGPYRVLLKHQNEWDGKKEQQKWEDTMTTNSSYLDKGDESRMPSLENNQRSDHKKSEKMDAGRTTFCEEAFPLASENRGSPAFVLDRAKSPESGGIIKASDVISAKKLDGVASGLPEVPQSLQSAPKDSSLIQKIEGLNAKARDNSSAKSKEEHKNKFHTSRGNHLENEGGPGSASSERTNAMAVINPSPPCVSTGDKNLESVSSGGVAIPRRASHGMQDRADHRNKERLNTQDTDGWWKKSLASDSLIVKAPRLETSNVNAEDRCTSCDTNERSESYTKARSEEEPAQTESDPSDSHIQRAKMKELAKQRTKLLQEEEEERIRKQKAKALAKLEELNRRTQEVDGSILKLDNATNSVVQNKQDVPQTSESTTVTSKSVANIVSQISKTNANNADKAPILSSEPLTETTTNAGKDPVPMHKNSAPLHHDIKSTDAAHHNNPAQVQNNIPTKQKRMGYKQKHNIPLEKSSTEKLVSTSTTTSKVEVATSSGIVTNEVASSLPMNQNATAESLVNHKKKNNRNGKSRYKVEETSSIAELPPSVSKETNLSSTSVESGKPRVSEFELDPLSVESTLFSRDTNQYLEQHISSPNEESHGRVNSQWKSQHSRRMPRNPQSSRSVEKFHGNDAVIWAPVRSQNKIKVTVDGNHIEAVNPSVTIDQQVQHNSKNKRAEMERYVPKPVAKEMSQQGSIQHVVAPSINQTTTDEIVVRDDSSSQVTEISQPVNLATGKAGSGMEPKIWDVRQNKQGKAHGSWRQRGSTESTNMHGMQDGLNYAANSSRTVPRSMEYQQSRKPEVSSMVEQTKKSNECSVYDGSSNPNDSDSVAPVLVAVVKDQSVTGRGRRHSFQGHKGMGINHEVDQKKNIKGAQKNDAQYSSSEPSQADEAAVLKEDQGVVDRSTSHWQPKSQGFASNNQRVSWPISGQNVGTEAGHSNKKDSTPHDDVPLPPLHEKEPFHVAQLHHDHSVSGKSNVGEIQTLGHQEAKRERRFPSQKGRPHSSNQGHIGLVEEAPASVDIRHGQHSSSGFHKSGNQNTRFGRGHESRGDRNSSGQNSKQHNQSANRERQGYNLHCEYQRVGPNNSKSDNSEQPKDGNHTGTRVRDRRQSHSRRGGGNFYGRPSGAVRVDADYE